MTMAFGFKLPDAYKCVDFNVFEALLRILTTVEKGEIDDIVNLCDPDECPDLFLPLLASKIGYDYFYGTTFKINREIIRNFTWMIKNKGNRIGLRLATSLALLISKGDMTDKGIWDNISAISIETTFSDNPLTANLKITYPTIENPAYDTEEAIKRMLKYVLPAGIGTVTLQPAIVSINSTTIKVDLNKEGNKTESIKTNYDNYDEFNVGQASVSEDSVKISESEVARTNDTE